MARKTTQTKETRAPLSRGRVVQAAIALADRDGLEGLTMRKLGQALRVEAMSLYRYVASRDDLLDGTCDGILAEIAIPPEDLAWRPAMRQRAHALHAVILRHPWAATLIESRTSLSPTRLRYANTLVGSLRRGGFSIAATYHAILTLDSYIYGFSLQEVSWSVSPEASPAVTQQMQDSISASDYPHLAEMMAYVVASRTARNAASERAPDYEQEFELGLELILDGLERHREAG